MARPKEFDENEALARATNVFWALGFKATTPEALLKAMGIGKGSFYATFGSKRELFVRCLLYYCNGLADFTQSKLAEKDLRKGLSEIRDAVIQSACGQRSGCLMYNTANELSPHDKEVEAIVKEAMSRIESLYIRRFRQAQAEGQIPSSQDAAALARFVITCFAGMQLTGKAHADAPKLRHVAKVMFKSLE